MTQEELISLQDLDDAFVLAQDDLLKTLDTNHTEMQARLDTADVYIRLVDCYAVILKLIEIY